MADHVMKLIEEIQAEIDQAEEAIKPKKQLVNTLCTRAGIAPRYADADEASAGSAPSVIRRNAFYGRPLSTCIKEYLKMRENLPVREATLDDIFTALKEGGYDLKASGSGEDDQKRGVAIAIGKNSQTFHRLPTGDVGLMTWYPNIREKKTRNGDAPTDDATEVPAPLLTPSGIAPYDRNAGSVNE